MRFIKFLIIIIGFCLINLTVVHAGTKPSGTEKKGDKLYQQSLYPAALKQYMRAYIKNKNRTELHLKIANTYLYLNQPLESDIWFKKAETYPVVWKSSDKLNYAKVLSSIGKYSESRAVLEQYSIENSKDSRTKRMLTVLDTLDALHRDSLRYSVHELLVNSSESDIPTAIFQHELYMMSSRKDLIANHKHHVWNNYATYKLHQSHIKKMGALTEPSMKATALTGPLSFYNGEKNAVVTRTTTLKHKTKKGVKNFYNLKLHFLETKDGGKTWENIAPFAYNNDSYSNSNPAMNSQGNIMFFVSDMPGGYGGTDLYVTRYDGTSWSKPENLGAGVNTESDELYPSLQNDSTLYFSSNGHGGLGGLDILRTSIGGEKFTNPLENLGYPINSKMDDFGIIWEDELGGFIASNRKDGKNDYNLFYFAMNKVPLRGIVKSSIDGKPITEVSLRLLENGKQKDFISATDSTGYQFMVYPGRQYILEGSGIGYRKSITKVSTKAIKNLEPITVDVTMKKLHQVFVNGITKDDSSNMAISNAKLRIVDASTSKQINIKTNSSGEFYAEIYPDIESYLVADNGSKRDIIKLTPSSMKDASVSYNVYPRLKKASKVKYNKILEKIDSHQKE